MSKKLKIMHVLKSSIYSGAEKVAITIMEKLRDQFDFVYVATDGSIREILEEKKLPHILLDKFCYKKLQSAIDRYQPDIVHAHDFSATALCALCCKGKNYQLVSHLHCDPPWAGSWNMKTLVYALCNSRISLVLTVSESMFDKFIFADRYRDRWLAIGNPVDGERIRSLGNEVTSEVQKEAYDMIYVGRFSPEKDPLRFVKLVHDLKEHGRKQIKACMIGNGELLESCEKRIQDWKLQDNLIMKGFQANPYPYVKGSSALCVTSRWEGYGLVAVEANLLGVPVLSTRNSGCTELFGEAAEELCDTDTEFEEKLTRLLTDASTAASWKERSERQGQKFDNIKEYSSQLTKIYENLRSWK